jgi:hypothetical protein
VAKLFRRRDRVLPRAPRLAREDAPGSRFESYLVNAPAWALAALEPTTARSAERDADHLLEGGSVAMPTDGRARRIPLHEDLGELLGLDAGELCSPNANGQKPVRDRFSGLRRPRAVVVVEAEVTSRASRLPRVHDDRIEAERVEPREQGALLVGREKLGPVDEPGRSWTVARGHGSDGLAPATLPRGPP